MFGCQLCSIRIIFCLLCCTGCWSGSVTTGPSVSIHTCTAELALTGNENSIPLKTKTLPFSQKKKQKTALLGTRSLRTNAHYGLNLPQKRYWKLSKPKEVWLWVLSASVLIISMQCRMDQLPPSLKMTCQSDKNSTYNWDLPFRTRQVENGRKK